MWKAVGVELVIQPIESSAFITGLTGGKFPLAIFSVGWPDASLLRLLYRSGSSLNVADVQDPNLDLLLDQITAAVDPAAQAEANQAVQRIIVEQAYTAPLYAEEVYLAASPRLLGLRVINNELPLTTVFLRV